MFYWTAEKVSINASDRSEADGAQRVTNGLKSPEKYRLLYAAGLMKVTVDKAPSSDFKFLPKGPDGWYETTLPEEEIKQWIKFLKGVLDLGMNRASDVTIIRF